MAVHKTYFMLMVADMARATRFYHEVFGCEPVFESGEWSELQSGGAVIALHGGARIAERETGLGFEVDDLEGTCLAVTKAGGTIVMPPSNRPGESIRLAMVRDPEGNRLSIAQPA